MKQVTKDWYNSLSEESSINLCKKYFPYIPYMEIEWRHVDHIYLSEHPQPTDTGKESVWWNGLEYPQQKILLEKYKVANDFLDSDIKRMYAGELQFNVCDKVLDLSDIEGEVIESPFAPALIRVSFGKGGSNWRDLNPQQLRKAPQPTDTGKEDDAMRMAYQAADMQDYENKTGQYADTVNTVSSEVGFTGGKWYAKGQNIYVTLDGERAQVASAFSPETMHSIREYNDKAPNNEAEANAQRIVQAVNNHDKLVSALKGLIIEATNSTKDIISFNGADDLDAAIDQAKALLTTINQTK